MDEQALRGGMDEQALRALVREAVTRHLGTPGQPAEFRPQSIARDASHYRYALQPSDGPCLIEPSVQCNHCGYCESHGH
jgi:hypothetical protein